MYLLYVFISHIVPCFVHVVLFSLSLSFFVQFVFVLYMSLVSVWFCLLQCSVFTVKSSSAALAPAPALALALTLASALAPASALNFGPFTALTAALFRFLRLFPILLCCTLIGGRSIGHLIMTTIVVVMNVVPDCAVTPLGLSAAASATAAAARRLFLLLCG